MCAQEWIRTITTLRMLRPEHSASTNFATWAGVDDNFFRMANIEKEPLPKPFFLNSYPTIQAGFLTAFRKIACLYIYSFKNKTCQTVSKN